LTGVDALVKDGIADANHLTIRRLQLRRIHDQLADHPKPRASKPPSPEPGRRKLANWGNDDTTFDDAYSWADCPAGSRRYRSEAAIFQIDKVRTPTHMVAGADDVRVAVLEDYLLDRALHELNIPADLLIFPGEGHSLDKNPWHGKIKVREELKWLEKYGGVKAAH